MRKEISVLLGLVAFATKLNATDIDLGAPGSYFNRTYDFTQLNAAPLNGQTVSVDLRFNNSAHLFPCVYPNFAYEIGFTFQTDGQGLVGFTFGRGTILDASGNPIFALQILGSASSDDDGRMSVGLFPLDTLTAPLDFYGAHFDLILPDNSNVSVTCGSLTLLATHDVVINGNRPVPFRIGPHVPESGNTISLFALALIGLFAISRAGNRSLRPLNGAPPK